MNSLSPLRLVVLLVVAPLGMLLLLLDPAATQESTCTNKDPCEGQPDCAACGAGEFVPDPEDCHSYYVCNADGNVSPLPFDCGEGQVFNGTGRECQDGDKCEPCSSITPGGSCTFECPETGEGKIPFPTDCSKYYTCVEGGPTEAVTCDDSTPFFNGVECQTNETTCCHCLPYCTAEDVTAFAIIPDPLDCRAYYLCTAAGVPTTHGECDEGEYFDSVLSDCSASATCNQESCVNVVGSDGCIDPFTCEAEGYFAKCPYKCNETYYHCTAATGEYQDAETCFTGTVFNPESHTCVSPDACP